MRVPAPAKINLHLRVGPPREDGFHPLLSWMATAGLFDTLTFVRQGHSRAADGDEPGAAKPIFALSCSDPSLPVDAAGNLVTRVATALADALRSSQVGEGLTAGVSAYLHKRIPAGAGLAGGSSDAVATLKALNRIWNADWDDSRLARFAQAFGSDLSFFFANTGSAVCTGRGEIVRPIAPPDIARWAVLVLPKLTSSTPAVYRRFDEMRRSGETMCGDGRHWKDEPDFAAWAKLPAAELMPKLVNDLEAPAVALEPRIGELRSALETKLSRVFRMSGSGSSLFSLCDSSEEAASLASQVKEELRLDAVGVQIAPKL
jgi:4-diphosphocytidyl-2-C-methyl-D-erythritol kinase